MPIVNRRQTGDMLITIELETPVKLTKSARKALEEAQGELAKATHWPKGSHAA